MGGGRVTTPGLLLAGLVGAGLGVGGYTVRYAEGLSYLSNDPRACVNCHVMREQYDGWQKASHHAVATCNDCHTPAALIPKYLVKAENGFWHSKGFTLQDFHEPITMRPVSRGVVEANCLRCHEELTSEIAGHGSNDCTRCHATVGHGAR
jgi:cytochrome c nitrite reductase small subunit